MPIDDKELDDLLDDLLEDDDDDNDPDPDKPEDKKPEDKPEPKKLEAIIPVVDATTAMQAAHQTMKISGRMEKELKEEYPELDEKEVQSIVDKMEGFGIENLAANVNAGYHRTFAAAEVGNKFKAGKITEKQRVSRETTSVGGGAVRGKGKTFGQELAEKFKNPKLEEWAKKTGVSK